ncbi:GTP-binding protein [Beijerinckia sp. L45]|uniref:CobW family GTP-binding protein n=1 Tax=Beijerinckia sp. L45 TaxID=1641855 RepID=UPI00131B0B5F|nr:GTP-binding protein [Beijerinckia sp. L45]
MIAHPAQLFGGGRFGRRLPRPGAGKVPVTVVTGFLGAGKTTLIRAALKHPYAANSVVIVNEFGEIGIDDVLIRTSTEEVLLIGNGCMCCAARHDLQRILRNLYAERETGAIPPFARVIVETSGLADPGPILQIFHADRTLADHYTLGGLVTVIDGVLASRAEAADAVWIEQVVQADSLILTKSDILGAEDAAVLTSRLAAINPQAPVIESEAARTDPALFLQQPVLPLQKADRDSHHGHEADYQSFVLRFEQPFDWALFTRAMDALVASRGEDILRVKGFVDVAGTAGPVVVNYVRHLASLPEELNAWPDADRATRLVFITRKLGRAKVAALFAGLLGLDD